MEEESGASAGHQLGQIVGNWYERWVAWPLLERVADGLGLYCDSRFKHRTCRGDKLIWLDADGNQVDYDFVIELGGTNDHRGIPVAFFECFWRRGARHSKDKARDDSGKLQGMRDAYPTARLLGILSSGDFTLPAQVLVQTRGIDLFYTAKDKILAAWAENGLQIDYADRLPEPEKRLLVERVRHQLASDADLYRRLAESTMARIGAAELRSFENRVAGKIGATPQHYSIYAIERTAYTFESRSGAASFLAGPEPAVLVGDRVRVYAYEVMFGDGDVFSRDDLDWSAVQALHFALDALVDHVEKQVGGS